MDDVARWPVADRADLFTVVANQRGGMNAELVEKDFWVCWVLRRLFTLTDAPAGMIFKGGTSLAKVFNAIGRFSEDIDLSFDRADLGFGGDNDPARAPSKKQTKQRLKMLKEACQTVIRDRFLPQLANAIGEALDDPGQRSWKLESDQEDPDDQTVLFHYASSFATRGPLSATYVPPVVRLEMGARSDHWPVENGILPQGDDVEDSRFDVCAPSLGERDLRGLALAGHLEVSEGASVPGSLED